MSPPNLENLILFRKPILAAFRKVGYMDNLLFDICYTETSVFIETSAYRVHVDTLHDGLIVFNKITGKHEVFSISLFSGNILESIGQF